MRETLAQYGIDLEYSITLTDGDVEFPRVMHQVADGDGEQFLDNCQQSCHALGEEAERLGLRVTICGRHSVIFPTWYKVYDKLVSELGRQVEADPSLSARLGCFASRRLSLYRDMGAWDLSVGCSQEMLIRQWAQCMTWGECSSRDIGADIVTLGHATPVLDMLNHPLVRKGRERIPLLRIR